MRILHHCGELVNKIKGASAEAELLRMLLQQTRWKRGSRGCADEANVTYAQLIAILPVDGTTDLAYYL